MKLEVLLEYKKQHPEAELNALLSYGTRESNYPQMLITHRDKIGSLILDSGAFTKNISQSDRTAGITLPGYMAYLKYNYKYFDFAFTYDQDFNLDGFDTNYPIMKKIITAGYPVVPVVHDYIGEERDEISVYVEERHPIIALGYSKHKKQNAIENIKKAIKPILAAGLKIHLLGLTSLEVHSNVPVHYSDSSSWAQEGLYGCTVWFNPNRVDKNFGQSRMYFKDRDKSSRDKATILDNHPDREVFLEYVNSQLGLTYEDLYGHFCDFNRQLVNVHYFIQLQDKIREIHKDLIQKPEWSPYFQIEDNKTQ